MMRIGMAALLLVLASASLSQTVDLPATRDVWVSSYSSERHFNMGAAPKLKLKIHQELALIDVDVTPLGQRSVEHAWLYVKPAGGHKFGFNDGTDLTWLVTSTVSHPWVEGQSTGYAEDHEGHGATFMESSFARRDWGWEGATLCDVSLGNGNTLRGQGRLTPAEDGWLRLPLEPRLVSALQSGATEGLLIMDGATYVLVNCFIASRESGQGPFIRVLPGPEEGAAPSLPAQVNVSPAADLSSPTHGAVRLTLNVPARAFSYDMTIDGTPAERWQIPFAADAGRTQTVLLRDLPAARECEIRVRAVSRTGVPGPWARVTATTSAALLLPELTDPRGPAGPPGPAPQLSADCRVWAAPPLTKIDPVTAEVLYESSRTHPRARNSVWDARTRQITLHTARGGIASCQLVFEGSVDAATISLGALTGPARIDSPALRQWRNWYVGRNAEVAMPLDEPIRCPWPDNDIDGQRLQSVTLTLAFPGALPAGIYRGTLEIADSGEAVTRLTLVVHAHAAVLPESIHFNPELNCYGGPGRAGSARFRDSFRLAHYHRCTINRVPYGQRGNTHQDWAPEVGVDGRVSDWTAFDRNLGGLLDGSWFAGNPRDGVPVPTLYLPLSISYPLDYLEHYNPGPGVPVNPADAEDLLKHDALARPPEQALPGRFRQGFVTCANDIAEHCTRMGWTETLFEFYLNNKPRYGYSVWTLDEPIKYRDWAALNLFGTWFKEAVNDPACYTPEWHRQLFEKGLRGMARDRATLLYRADVSRPQWQGSVSDGIINLMICNNGIFQYPRLIADHKRRMPCTVICYGSCNAVDRSNWETVAWCLQAYAHGADGVIPWQSLAGEKALRQADTNALIIDAGARGQALASLRVHALREGAELCELLRLVQLKQGWTREQIRALLAKHIDLSSTFRQRSTDEAAAVTFRELNAASFIGLKTALLSFLDPSSAAEAQQEQP